MLPKMNGKERVHRALRRRACGPRPGLHVVSSADGRSGLARLLEIPVSHLAEAMGDDVRQTWVNNNYAMEGVVHEREGDGHVDFWGVEWTQAARLQPDHRIPPGRRPSREEVLALPFPDRAPARTPAPDAPRRWSVGSDYFIGCDVSPCVFEMYWRLRGMENAILDMATDPSARGRDVPALGGFRRRVVRGRLRPLCLGLALDGRRRGFSACHADEPGHLARLIKPHLARVAAVGKRRGLWVAYHCCGALAPIIPDLIEIGIDVLNPGAVQLSGNGPAGSEGGIRQSIFFHGRRRHARRPAPRKRGGRATGHGAADRGHDLRRWRLHPGGFAYDPAGDARMTISSPCTPKQG